MYDFNTFKFRAVYGLVKGLSNLDNVPCKLENNVYSAVVKGSIHRCVGLIGL